MAVCRAALLLVLAAEGESACPPLRCCFSRAISSYSADGKPHRRKRRSSSRIADIADWPPRPRTRCTRCRTTCARRLRPLRKPRLIAAVTLFSPPQLSAAEVAQVVAGGTSSSRVCASHRSSPVPLALRHRTEPSTPSTLHSPRYSRRRCTATGCRLTRWTGAGLPRVRRSQRRRRWVRSRWS